MIITITSIVQQTKHSVDVDLVLFGDTVLYVSHEDVTFTSKSRILGLLKYIKQ